MERFLYIVFLARMRPGFVFYYIPSGKEDKLWEVKPHISSRYSRIF